MAKALAIKKKPRVPAKGRGSNARRPQKKKEPELPVIEVTATLGRLIETLGSEILDVLTAPRGLEVKVAEVVIFDPAGGTVVAANDIVLGVGAGSDARLATEIIRDASASGASAVALKATEKDVSHLTEFATSHGIALLRIPLELRWDQLHTLVRTAIGSTGDSADIASGAAPVGDLFSLANAVAAMVGGPVTIEDPQSRVLAYSSLDEPIDEPRRQTILGRRIPETWMKRLHEAGVFKKIWTTDEVVRFEGFAEEGLHPRLVTAVRAGGEILGSIWVQEGPKPFPKAAENALREAARIASLHLIRHHTGRDIERRMRGDALRSILEGRGPANLLASRLSLDVEGPYTVMAFELDSEDEADLALYSERLTHLIALYSEAFHRRPAAVAVGRAVYALIPSPETVKRERIVSLAQEAVTRAESTLKVRVRAGIGSRVEHLRRVPQSRSEADQALRVLVEGRASGKVGDIDRLRPATILLELRDLASERPHLKLGKLQVLALHDKDHGTDYLRTLKAYLDFFGDIPSASSEIGVHPNTFRYRIRRLTELSGLALDDPDERLVTEFQLRL
jgi:hypothetical protein